MLVSKIENNMPSSLSLNGFVATHKFELRMYGYCLCDLIGSRDIKIPSISRDLFFERDL